MDPSTSRFPDITLALPISIEERVVEQKEITPAPDANTESKALPNSSQLEKKESAKLQEQIVAKSLLAATANTKPVDTNGLREIKDAATFREAILAAKYAGKEKEVEDEVFRTLASTSFGASVNAYPVEDYAKMRLFLSNDKFWGVALKDVDVVSVFRHRDGRAGALDTLMPRAIAEGGRRLDCFNIGVGGLPYVYSKYGFVPVAKVKFDPSEAPEDWNSERDKEPDIIFMAYDEDIAKNIETEKTKRYDRIDKSIEKLPFSSYNEAVETQKQFLKSKQQ